MVATTQKPRATHRPPRAGAGFVVQLLAAREGLESQRLKRRASGSDAARAYEATGALAIKRLPAGYRTDSDA